MSESNMIGRVYENGEISRVIKGIKTDRRRGWHYSTQITFMEKQSLSIVERVLGYSGIEAEVRFNLVGIELGDVIYEAEWWFL